MYTFAYIFTYVHTYIHVYRGVCAVGAVENKQNILLRQRALSYEYKERAFI